MNATILGCGYVGKVVARHWQQQGLNVTATTTSLGRVSELETLADQVAVVQGNDASELRSLLANQQTVLVSVGAPNANAYEQTYLATAKTLAAVLPDTAVEQVIYTGSYAVYGDQQGDWVDETTAIAPANRNGEILAETEQVLLSMANGQRHVCIFRLGGIYGPNRELVKIFGRAAGTTRPGRGDEPSNWIHLDDIVGAIEFARQHQLDGIYNLVQDVTFTVRELLDQVCSRHNLASISWDPSQPSARPYNAKVSNQKLKAAGYTFIHPQMLVE